MKLDNNDNNTTSSTGSGTGKKSINKKSEFYAIAKGRMPGIYDNWPLAEKQVNRFSGAVFKGFQTKGAAEAFMIDANILDYNYYLAINPKDFDATASTRKRLPQPINENCSDLPESTNSSDDRTPTHT